jgi:hypothetical protein
MPTYLSLHGALGAFATFAVSFTLLFWAGAIFPNHNGKLRNNNLNFFLNNSVNTKLNQRLASFKNKGRGSSKSKIAFPT